MNAMWESLNQLIQDLDTQKIKDLLYRLGAEDVIEKEGYLITNTICHNIEGGSMKLYYYKDNKFFYCYSNCHSLSIFNFLKEYYKTREYDYDWYDDIIKVVEGCTHNGHADFRIIGNPQTTSLNVDKVRGRKRLIELPEFDAGVLDVFVEGYNPVWKSEGISDATLKKFNIRYSISQNKIVIPHYDVCGRLVGIRGRALEEWEVENVGKYMPMKIENIWYNHKLSLNLYGLNENIKNIKTNGICYVCEGEKSVLLAEEFDMPNCTVAICGSNFNKFALNILLKNCRPTEIVICFDKEEKCGSDKYFQKLYNLCKKYNNYCDFSFIYDRENLLDMKDSPFDKGEEVFKQLLKRRVKVKSNDM